MQLAEIVRIILLILLIGCAVAVNLTPSLLQAVIIFMSYSSIMCVLWVLMDRAQRHSFYGDAEEDPERG